MPFALSVEALLLTIKLSMCADRVKAVTSLRPRLTITPPGSR